MATAFWAVALCLLASVARAEAPARAERAENGESTRETTAGVGAPSLREVIARARDLAPEVVVGAAAVESTRSGLVGARRPPVGNPYLEFTGERPTSGSWGGATLLGTLWLPLEVAGQTSVRVAEADANIELSRRHLVVARALATADAVRAYGMVVVASERARLLDQLVEFSRSEAALYEARFQGGDATLRDTRLAAVELGRYEVLLEEARADLAAALSKLGSLTGAAYSEPPSGELHPPVVETSPRIADDAPTLAVSLAEARYFERVRDRLRREGNAGAMSAMAIAGRGELGDVRVGAGIAYAFPVLHRNQGEQARAEAERVRARTEESVKRRTLRTRLAGLAEELSRVRRASERLDQDAEPAAAATLDAVTEMHRAGKSDLFAVLASRRELALLSLRRIDLAAREWGITSEIVAITGRAP